MILVPLPFFVSLLLLTILVQTVRRDGAGLRANPLFVALIAAYAIQSVLVGLRWGYDWRGVLPLMAPLAALIAPLAWLSFRSLTREEPVPMAALWPHLLPAAAVIALMIMWPDPVGAVIVAVFAGYGLALLWKARLGPNGLVASRLDGVVRSHRAMQITGAALLASAATDIVISLDFTWNESAHSGMVVALGSVVALLVLGGAASVAGAGLAGIEADDPNTRSDPPAGATSEDLTTAALVDRLMQEQEIYRDLDLNLERIARKLRLPPRDVSSAINRAYAMSVSQYVNTHRVKRARQLLKDTADPVTKVMFDAGFGTKSNFNREFQRVTGMTPSAYRRAGSETFTVSNVREAAPGFRPALDDNTLANRGR